MFYKKEVPTIIKNIFLLLFIMNISSTAYGDIAIKKKLETAIEKKQIVYVFVKNDGYKDSDWRKRGSEEAFVEMEISDALDEFGVNTSANEAVSTIKVECHFRHGWGMPRLIRHFKIKSKYITTVNIKLIDVSKKAIIGEVEYKRPWSKTNPNGFIKMMLDKLLSRGIRDIH
ncbi:MAG: hypothetical protein GY705_31185 [Bacteroidetes bacterium]|nr:hypothetical protein [Bacteroidota bacterium]